MLIASVAAPVPNTKHGTQQNVSECLSIVNSTKLETAKVLAKTRQEGNANES